MQCHTVSLKTNKNFQTLDALEDCDFCEASALLPIVPIEKEPIHAF